MTSRAKLMKCGSPRVELVRVARRKLCSDSKQISSATTGACKFPSSQRSRYSFQGFVPAIQLANMQAVLTAITRVESPHEAKSRNDLVPPSVDRSDSIQAWSGALSWRRKRGCCIFVHAGGHGFDSVGSNGVLVRTPLTSTCSPAGDFVLRAGYRSVDMRKTVCPSRSIAGWAAQRCSGRLFSLLLS